MSILSCRFSMGIAVVALYLGGVACSSTPLKKAGDAAAVSDTGVGKDGLAPDVALDMVGPDRSQVDLSFLDSLPPAKEVGVADVPAVDAPAADALSVDTSIVVDTPSVDLPFAGDGPSPDVLLSADLASRDAAADRASVCTPGLGQTCNDSPIASWISGTCLSDGTCICKTGFVQNPSTGHCRLALPSDASTAGEAGSDALCSGTYVACGCGCCSSTSTIAHCYYPSLGDSIAAIKSKDQTTASSPNCKGAGCSAGILSVCCLPPAPESPDSATYAADWYSGDVDNLHISKGGADCATLSFARPVANTLPEFRITTPSSWGVMGVPRVGACSDAGPSAQAIGAVGNLAFRLSGNLCLVDLHVTLFSIAGSGGVKTSGLNVDGLVVPTVPVALCH